MTGNGAIRITCAFALAIAFGSSQGVGAQRLSEGAIRGTVRNEAGVPVGTAVVTLRDRLTGAETIIESALSGAFLFSLVAAGEYDLTVEAFGHRPLRVERVQVRGGETTRLDPLLGVTTEAAPEIDVRYFPGAAGGTSSRFTAGDLARYAWPSRELSAVARLTSTADPSLENEGLPGSITGVYVNGLPIGNGLGPAARSPAFPLSAFRQAEFLTTSADVEWSAGATGGLSAQTMTAGSRFEVRTFGDWTTGPAQTDPLRAPVHSGFQAGALVSGPLISDTSSFVVGVETWRLETPIAFAPRFDSVAARVANVANETYGRPEAGVLSRVARSDAFSGFARLDWRFSEGNTLTAAAALTSLPRSRTLPLLVDRAGSGADLEGMDAFVSASLASRFNENFGQELRLGWDRGVRDFADDTNAASTLFVNDGFALGGDPMLVGRYAGHTLRVREALYLAADEHFFKAGFSADLASYDQTFMPQNRSTFWFSSADAFASGSGYVVQTNGTSAVSFKVPRYGAFIQDEISFATRLRVLVGARWDIEMHPFEDVAPNLEWFRLSGIAPSATMPKRRGRLSPRVEFEWRPDVAGKWSVRGAGGVWDAPSDPLLMGELLANDGRIRVHRAFGAFADWPNSATQAGAPTLTLLAPGFQGARSTRAALQLNHRLAPSIELQFGGVLRRTEQLPRRADLNRAAEPVGTDQYGRDLYGTLVQQGGMLTADPGSNRRFSSFDIVSAIGVDGWSEYRAFNAAVHAQLSERLNVDARYTYSSTRDNWFMAREAAGAAAVLPFAADGTEDWSESTSDFDVPHRAVLGADVELPVLRGIRFAGLFRFQSGRPFTPGFRDGVDANADGSLRNDPAFIDPTIPGLDALSARWNCVRENVNAFAPRNSCRADNMSFLDARVAIGLFGTATARAELIVDALNLVSRGAAIPDHALYLVDASRSLERAGGVTNVPLTVNPNFGAPLIRTAPGRMFRIGFSLKY